MKAKFVIPALALSATVAFFSCKKSDSPAKSRTELLTNVNGWKLTRADANVGGVPTNIFDVIEPGCKDDLIYFETDSTVYVEENGICTSGEAPFSNGEWKFGTGENSLILTPSGDTLTIVSLDESAMVVNYDAGVIYGTVKGTFGHP